MRVKRRRHTPEQVTRKLRRAERMLAEGKQVPEVAKALEVSEQTFHRWPVQYGAKNTNRSSSHRSTGSNRSSCEQTGARR